MKPLLLALSAVLVSSFSTVGCSSSPPPIDPDKGITNDNNTGTCGTADQNPYGTCYPTADLGTSARKGTTPGNRIRNFTFVGYPWDNTAQKVDTSNGTKTISLAQYFDPDGKLGPNGTGIKVIHITVAAVWCGPCNQETDAISGKSGAPGFAAELADKGVVFVQALSDGAVTGTGATLNDLNIWINNHNSNFTEMLDPGVKNLGVFFDAAAVPFNANIDARSMEILDAGVGFNPSLDQEVLTWVNWESANPPKQ